MSGRRNGGWILRGHHDARSLVVAFSRTTSTSPADEVRTADVFVGFVENDQLVEPPALPSGLREHLKEHDEEPERFVPFSMSSSSKIDNHEGVPGRRTSVRRRASSTYSSAKRRPQERELLEVVG